MNIEVRQSDVRSNSKLKIVDVDIHPKSSIEDLKPYLSQRWWEHLITYGVRQRAGMTLEHLGGRTRLGVDARNPG